MNAEPETKFFAMAPFFHQLGHYIAIISIFHGVPFVLSPPEKPLTVELLSRIMDETSPTITALFPSVIEDLSSTEEGRATLHSFETICFGSAPLAEAAATRLSNLETAMGTTETGLIPHLIIEGDDVNHEGWQYFEWLPGYGVEMAPLDNEGRHELILHRETLPGAKKNENDRDAHPVFHTFPHLEEYRTNDVFQQHPTKPKLWKYYGRLDDVIVLSNGEKFNPTEMEKVIDGHPLVAKSLIVGNDRFHAAVLIEPNWQELDASNIERNAFVNEIWPFVDKANEIAPAYGRLIKSKIAIAAKDKPFEYTPKGSMRRGVIIADYMEEIDHLYSAQEEENQYSFPKNETLDKVTETVASMVAGLLSIHRVSHEADIFTLGIDSFQTLRLSMALLNALRSTYPETDANVVSSQKIYSHSSVTELSKYIHSLLHEILN